MFAKVFSQIYDSSIVEKPEVRFTFMDFLLLADPDGVVDITHEAIARRTNRPIELIRATIAELEAEDPKSRSEEHGGARIKRLDEHRDWGWIIVNYTKFRQVASDEDRREKTRERVRKFRAKHDDSNAEKHDVTLGNACNAKQKQKQKQKQKDSTYPPTAVEEIYQQYPRKVDRAAALKAIERALKTTAYETLLEKTKQYAAARKGCDERFTPHPKRWFANERYNEPPENWRNGEKSVGSCENHI